MHIHPHYVTLTNPLEYRSFDLFPTALNYGKFPPPIRWGLSWQGGRYSERRVHKLRDAPSPIRHTNSLRRRHAEGFMHTAEIVVCNVQRNGGDVVVQFL